MTELSFGFWVGLLAKRYDQTLWVPAVHRAFVGYRGSRWQMEDGVRSILLFRNRIAHHEHIHTRDLRADHAKIHRLLGCLSPEFVRWWEPSDRVDEVLGRKPPLGGGTT